MKLSKTDRYLFMFLSTANTTQIKAIISTLNLCQQKTLIEISYYILQGVVPVTTGEKMKLYSHQKNIRKKIANSLSTRQRRTRLLKIVTLIPMLIKIFFKYDSGNECIA
jgi:hypothetical protein